MASPLHVGTWTRPSMFAAVVLALAGTAALATAALVGGTCERGRERVETRTPRCGDGPRRHHGDHHRQAAPDRERACRHALRQVEGLRLRLGDDAPAYLERRDAVLRACVVK